MKTIAQQLIPVDSDGTKAITQRFRDLAMAVTLGHSELFPFIYHVHRHNRSEAILRYLVEQKLVGKELVEWIGFHHGKAMHLTALAHIIRKMDNDGEIRPIIAGKDYLV